MNSTLLHLTRFALVASLALRVLVPAGLMPANGDDWHLELCPEDMGASALHALLGHGNHGDHLTGAQAPEYEQCDLGVGAGTEALEPPSPVLAVTSVTANEQRVAAAAASFVKPTPRPYLTRAPPQPSSRQTHV